MTEIDTGAVNGPVAGRRVLARAAKEVDAETTRRCGRRDQGTRGPGVAWGRRTLRAASGLVSSAVSTAQVSPVHARTDPPTATVVAQPAAERKLSLDDTVEKWLPGLVKGNGYDGREITITT
ncbi:hypothetical protein FHR32_002433 [Streptosporangium album]|uniref:Uncharacterized protein n=1 Tax=Streptosporangium album TaxID=47479 RepID=A0A7W7W8P2_9ACTN|nr:hypothetical protein [Streptosporangium album]